MMKPYSSFRNSLASMDEEGNQGKFEIEKITIKKQNLFNQYALPIFHSLQKHFECSFCFPS